MVYLVYIIKFSVLNSQLSNRINQLMKFNHIILITQDFPPDAGGIQTWCVELSKNFANSGTKVTVLTKSYDGFVTEPFVYEKIEVIRLPHKNWKKDKNKLCLKELKRCVTKDSIILSSNWKMGVPAYFYNYFHSIPYFVVCHGLDAVEYRKANKILQKRVFKKSAASIAVSSYTKRFMYENDIKSTIHVINNGVDLNLYSKVKPSEAVLKKYQIDRSKFNLLNVGRLEERKGFDYTISAIKDIENVLFHIGGTGKYEKALNKLVDELDLRDKVIFHGFIPDEDMNELFNAVDLFVMPSRQVGHSVEGFGITYLEAAACGTPSIGGKNSGAADAIEDGKSGLLINSDSVDSIRDGIQYLIDNPNRLLEMGEYAKERAKSFTWKIIADKFVELFNNKL